MGCGVTQWSVGHGECRSSGDSTVILCSALHRLIDHYCFLVRNCIKLGLPQVSSSRNSSFKRLLKWPRRDE